ncbi:hypothetical protein ACFQ1L_44970 [Phytohabitans flavus]|uniref:hypothetical protein n=1 Tax=Phytohabitans flavus TaxID=1076124 RepID=UPI0036256E78
MTDGPVRQASLREHNLGLVLRQAANAMRPPSRADIAAATSLTRATVSALVDDLIAGGLLTEVGPAPRAGAGRPAAGLVLSASGPAGLGLEINVDYLAACVVDLAGPSGTATCAMPTSAPATPTRCSPRSPSWPRTPARTPSGKVWLSPVRRWPCPAW